MPGAEVADAIRGSGPPLGIVIKPHPVIGDWRPSWMAAWRRLANRDRQVRLVSDTHADVVPYMLAADLLVTDASSVAFEYLALDRPIVLCVASFYAYHARELLVEATSQSGALLVLVGGDPVRSDDVLGMGPVPHDRVPEYVSAADLCAYVLRSQYPDASFSPLKVFEYMAAARPVVAATDLEEIRTFVNEHGIGYAVGLDKNTLTEAMRRLLQDADLREEMGLRGREWAVSTYSWDNSAENIEASLASALRASGG